MRFRTILVMSAIVMAPALAYGEEKAGPPTEIQGFMATTGKTMMTVSHPIDEISAKRGTKVRVGTLAVSEAKDDTNRRKGMTIDIIPTGDLKSRVYLDAGELDPLIASIDSMMKIMAEWKGSDRDPTEMSFGTKGGLKVGFNLSRGNITIFVRALTGGAANAELSSSDMEKLRSYLDSGRTLLMSN